MMYEIMDSRRMAAQASNLSFRDKERLCEQHFEMCRTRYGEFWHICTPGYLSEILFTDEEDFRFAISNAAISAAESGVMVITDCTMTNHIHSLAAGTVQQCRNYLDVYRYRLSKYLDKRGKYISLKGFTCDSPIPVPTLDAVRNEIVYINRNGYVVNSAYTPFSYPWGSGYLYFNPLAREPRGIPYQNAAFTEKRRLSMRRVADMPSSYRYHRGMILPESYVRYDLGEKMFRDAHHYLNLLTRNVEAYSEEAKRLSDTIVLSDEEIYPAARMLSEKRCGVKQPSLLPVEQKIEIARAMVRDYHASGAQVRRIFKLPDELHAQLFPSVGLER